MEAYIVRAFVWIFAFLLAASYGTWLMRPPAQPQGKTPLVWVSDDNPARRENIRLFNHLHPALDLRLDPQGDGSMQKVIVQSHGGVGPDLFDCYSPQELSAYVKSGVAWDVTDDLAAAGIDLRDEAWAVCLPYVLYQGRAYGFPANAATDVLWFNKDIFEAEGIAPPEGSLGWEEFIVLAQKLTKRDAQGRAIRYGFSFDSSMWKFFLYQWNGRVYSDDGRWCTLDSPEAVAAVQFLYDLIYKHKVMPSPGEEDAISQEGGWGSATMKLVAAGRVATALGGRWWLCTLRNYSGLRLGAVVPPHGPRRKMLGYGKSTLINKNSPHRQQALAFLLYMAGADYNRLINRQADGLAPMKRYARPEILNHPDYPEEDFHAVFPKVMELGVAEEMSPYINTALADRIIRKQLDLVRRNAKQPQAAMRDAARQIDAEIEKTLRRNPLPEGEKR